MSIEPQPLSSDPRARLPRMAVARADAVPQIHTLDEAAAILRVKKSWLERQAAARKIPFTMLGGAYHLTSAHLTAIVAIHESAVTAPRETTRKTRSSHPPARRPSGTQDTRPLRPRPRPDPRSAA